MTNEEIITKLFDIANKLGKQKGLSYEEWCAVCAAREIITDYEELSEVVPRLEAQLLELSKGSQKHQSPQNEQKIGETRSDMGDKVKHPSHYTDGKKYETICVIEDNLTEEGFEGFCIGCVFKYISRYRKKNGLEDLEKAAWYLNCIIEKQICKRKEHQRITE